MWRIVEVEEGKGEEGSREELRRGRGEWVWLVLDEGMTRQSIA